VDDVFNRAYILYEKIRNGVATKEDRSAFEWIVATRCIRKDVFLDGLKRRYDDTVSKKGH
jgi:hypothetical protein